MYHFVKLIEYAKMENVLFLDAILKNAFYDMPVS